MVLLLAGMRVPGNLEVSKWASWELTLHPCCEGKLLLCLITVGSGRNKIRRKNRRVLSVNSIVFDIRVDSALMCVAVSPGQLRNLLL